MIILYRLIVLFQLSIITSHQGIDAFGFMHNGSAQKQRNLFVGALDQLPASESTVAITENTAAPESRTPCFWKGKGDLSKWKERIHIEDLFLGQELSGHVVDDLLGGKTGPKVFFECGVGRTSKGNWKIVHGMLRLPRSKASVATKRAARLRKKKTVQLFVSRIQKGCGRFEVCATKEEAEKFFNFEKKRPISSLNVGEEVTGVVVKLLPYGALVDVSDMNQENINRVGLLHIRTVAELYNRYIDKEKGLIAAGLERGAKIRLSVASVEKRRLSLEFTPDVRNASENLQENNVVKDNVKNLLSPNSSDAMTNAELSEWAEYATKSQSQAPITNENEYDEDKEIEDSLGLGFY